ncbi:MAG TPA: ATP-dependent Clp protease ATP-binding subunit [Verrucomicrobiae bacterium]|nr:ATP-dependent Clp protease ATP-binding subunit [Verrucomicrobiae bacterium]
MESILYIYGMQLCDICGLRPATTKLVVRRNGQERVLHLCAEDYAQIRQRQSSSPFEALLFGEHDPLDAPVTNRESVDITKYLSESARATLDRAALVAGKFGRREIDTEHLLYALTQSELIEQVLTGFKLRTEDIRGYIDANTLNEGKEAESFTLTPRVKQVMLRSFQVSQEMGHSYIGPEHMLVALVEEQDGMAGELLRKLGLTPQNLREKTLKVLGAKERGADLATVDTPTLNQYSRDLTAKAKQGKLDPVIGRASEIESTIEILSRRTKNNPVLIGEPGVGKTAIVEGLAQKVVSGMVPEELLNRRVLEVNINAIVAGTRFRGEFEERIQNILKEITEHKDSLIVFIDELHTLIGAGQGGGEGGLDASNIIKPALARGDLHLIGATTLNEYQKHIEKDAALERRFQPVLVGEPTPEQAIEILRGLRDAYEAHHKVRITDESLTAAVELSDRYITNRFLPDKAIDLVDQAAARVKIAMNSFPPEKQEMDEKLASLRREHEAAISHKDDQRVEKLAKEIEKTEVQCNKLVDKWRKEKGVASPEVTVRHIAEVVAKLTGVPVSELTEEEKERLTRLEERLKQRVIGQEEAITAVANAVRVSRAGLTEGKRPIATLMFLGPTGVGKTELAKALAEMVFGSEDAMIRIDMSEYMERHSVSRMIGSPPGYVGYDEGGQLTEPVRRRPYAVILLDEIEKAHPDVYNILLQLFDDGRLTDGKGRVVDFSNTIIIATSNLGSDLRTEFDGIGFKTAAGSEKPTDEAKDRLMNVLRGHFRPEFINRLDEVVVFHQLSEEQIASIVRLQLERVIRVAHGQGITLSLDESVVRHLAEVGYAPEFGARELRRKIKRELENELARQMLEGIVKEGAAVKVSYTKGAVSFKVAKPVAA